MEENEMIRRINALCEARSWTLYRLAKESGIPYSTLCTMLHKSNAPSIPTLVKLCSGFGITLAEFFDTGADRAMLTQQQRSLLTQWERLSAENQRAAQQYIQYLLSSQESEK